MTTYLNLNEDMASAVFDQLDQKQITAAVTKALVRHSNPDAMLTKAEVTELLSISIDTLNRMIEEGILPATYIGPKQTMVRISRVALSEYIRANTNDIQM